MDTTESETCSTIIMYAYLTKVHINSQPIHSRVHENDRKNRHSLNTYVILTFLIFHLSDKFPINRSIYLFPNREISIIIRKVNVGYVIIYNNARIECSFIL